MATTILIGVDGSAASQRAVDLAFAQQHDPQTQWIIAHIIEWSPYSFNTAAENDTRRKQKQSETEAAQQQLLDPLAATHKDKGEQVSTLVRYGHPAQALNEIAAEHGVTQIFIGRRGKTKFKELLFGSVASHLIQTTKVPVTVVP